MCPNMIDFDGVNFSEHRSEEVISFFWRSVYRQLPYKWWRPSVLYAQLDHPQGLLKMLT